MSELKRIGLWLIEWPLPVMGIVSLFWLSSNSPPATGGDVVNSVGTANWLWIVVILFLANVILTLFNGIFLIQRRFFGAPGFLGSVSLKTLRYYGGFVSLWTLPFTLTVLGLPAVFVGFLFLVTLPLSLPLGVRVSQKLLRPV